MNRFSLKAATGGLLGIAVVLLGFLYFLEERSFAGPHESFISSSRRSQIENNVHAKAAIYLDAPRISFFEDDDEDFDENGDRIEKEDEFKDNDVDDDDDYHIDDHGGEESRYPLQSKSMSFGKRHGHRLAHLKVRRRASSTSPLPSSSNPVLDEDLDDFIPFRTEFIREQFRDLPRVAIEAEYFRFQDELGLIDTGWTDEQILQALQTLVDIYAQGNIHIRLRKRESLARVKLSRARSLAYWFYVDYPRNAVKDLSEGRLARRQLLDQVLGQEFVSLLMELDKERQGLFDFITGWPEERTPWENANVVGMYPSFYYQFMNGGGNEGCMRFRTGDCNTIRPVQLKKDDFSVSAMCYRFAKRSGQDAVVRSWEKYNFTANMAIRLVAHEFGHSVKLHHFPTKEDCLRVSDWPKANLMNQVLKMAPTGHTCRVTGWPELAALATYLTDEQIELARSNIVFDLRETSPSKGTRRIGSTTEVLPTTCLDYSVTSFVALKESPEAGRIRRIRWKSANSFSPNSMVKVSVGKFDPILLVFTPRQEMTVPLHSLGSAVHQEQNLDVKIHLGEAIVLSSFTNEDLAPQTRRYESVHVLMKDVINAEPMSKREHPAINQLISQKDKDSIYPGISLEAEHVTHYVLEGGKWISMKHCGKWIFNFDLEE